MIVFPLTFIHSMTLTNLLIFSLVLIANAFYIIGFNRACQYDEQAKEYMILWRVKYYSEKWLGAFWSKPVYSCPTCMASLHGIIPFVITDMAVNGLSYYSLLRWVFYTVSLAGLTSFINER